MFSGNWSIGRFSSIEWVMSETHGSKRKGQPRTDPRKSMTSCRRLSFSAGVEPILTVLPWFAPWFVCSIPWSTLNSFSCAGERGMDERLTKPVIKEQLFEALKNATQEKFAKKMIFPEQWIGCFKSGQPFGFCFPEGRSSHKLPVTVKISPYLASPMVEAFL